MSKSKTQQTNYGSRKFKTTGRKKVSLESQNANDHDKHSFDVEAFSALAAFEWMALTEEDREKLHSVGIKDQLAFVDVRLGMRHSSSKELIGWAEQRGIGYVRTQKDLLEYFADQFEALSSKCMHAEFTQGIDLIEQYRTQTRHLKITTGILSITLPSGSRYYYSPYQTHTPQRALWLLNAYQKVFSPATVKRR